MKQDKPFRTYNEQIKLLCDEKGLIIKDKEKAVALLKKHSYFGLINGYKAPFKNKNKKYKKKTSFEDIYALYCFDNDLRFIFLENILIVESHIKSLLSYYFTEKFGCEETVYLAATNYNYEPANQSEINKLVSVLKDTLDNNFKFDYMRHQKKEHSNVPLWVLIKALTFGTLSKMYSLLLSTIQAKISKEFYELDEANLGAMLDVLSRFRNVCAHNERLFDYKYKKRTIPNTKIHIALQLEHKNGSYIKGKSDLFSTIIALKYLLTKKEFDTLIFRVNCALTTLFAATKQIQNKQLFKLMGFPENWEDIKDIEIDQIKISKTIS